MPTAQIQRSATTITACGELDIAMVPALDRQLRAAEHAASVVVLDLRSLEFLDSIVERSTDGS